MLAPAACQWTLPPPVAGSKGTHKAFSSSLAASSTAFKAAMVLLSIDRLLGLFLSRRLRSVLEAEAGRQGRRCLGDLHPLRPIPLPVAVRGQRPDRRWRGQGACAGVVALGDVERVLGLLSRRHRRGAGLRCALD